MPPEGRGSSNNVVRLDQARSRAELAAKLNARIDALEHKLDLCTRAAGSEPTNEDVALAAKNWAGALLSVVQAWRTVTDWDRGRR